jgi:protein involved in polysaccharide export with SLBB domain
LTNPTLNGIPVRRLPTELLSSPRREILQTLPLSLLRQQKPEDYLLAPGDVLGVYIAGVFPLTFDYQQSPLPPVNFPSRIDPLGAGLPPSLGYPIEIRNDGTIALPLIDPIRIEGMNVERANEEIRRMYLDKGILQPGRESVLVTLMQPRQVRVTVFRQEVGGFAAGGRGDITTSNLKQGTGHVVDLRAYENDVLRALSYTGGLPGLDAYDGVFIFRGGMSHAELTQRLESTTPDSDPESWCKTWTDAGVDIVHIPTRWPPGEPLPFLPEDIVLEEGDVVFLEARTRDLFYTGGLLPRGEFQIPRDYDLDVLEAIAQIRGTLVNGAFGGNNLNGLLIQPGIGSPNPSALTVVRRTPNGGQIPISVDLNRALRDPRERILIQPGDVLILQETTGEAIARYFTNIFNFRAASALNATSGIGSVSVP